MERIRKVFVVSSRLFFDGPDSIAMIVLLSFVEAGRSRASKPQGLASGIFRKTV